MRDVLRYLNFNFAADILEMLSYMRESGDMCLPRNQGFKVKDMSPRHAQTITVAKKEPFKRLNRRMGRM